MEKRSTANHVSELSKERRQTFSNRIQVYHSRCFRCRICKRNLTGASLNEEGDDIYCASEYKWKYSR